MDYKFNQDGLLGQKELREAIDEFVEKNGKLKLTERTHLVVREYMGGKSIEQIADKLVVTRERVRQILAKAQRTIGIKPPSLEYIYGPLTLNEWKDQKQMGQLEKDIQVHLLVFGVNPKDVEVLNRLIFISLRNYFEDKKLIYENEED